MGFNTKQPAVNYTVMVTKAANGYVLLLLNADGETIMTAIASEYGMRDYSNYNFITAMEALWDYAEQLEKDKQALAKELAEELAENFDTVPHESDVTMQQLLDEHVAAESIAESKESEL